MNDPLFPRKLAPSTAAVLDVLRAAGRTGLFARDLAARMPGRSDRSVRNALDMLEERGLAERISVPRMTLWIAK